MSNLTNAQFSHDKSPITQAFHTRKAFIAFLTCGDPDIDFSEQVIYTLIDNGVDIIELGVPFSDPVAEGEVIQLASKRALDSHTSLHSILMLAKRLTHRVPLVLMSYANPIFAYGVSACLNRALEAGIHGVIVPDVPYEELEAFFPSSTTDIDIIPLITQTSTNRLPLLTKRASGFLYCVSSRGVTGMRKSLHDNSALIHSLRDISPLPIAIGFGISTPEQAMHMASIADGVIIGSAIVSTIALPISKEERLKRLAIYARSIRNALDTMR